MTNNHLNTFRILFMVKGILTLVFSLFFVFYATIGGIFSNVAKIHPDGTPPPFNPGIIFVIIGITGFVFCIIHGTLTLFASKFIKERRRYTFIFVVAILNCFTGVLGILLCVFTLIELNKPEVKALFEEQNNIL